jgi:general secretion pathway protein A
VDAGETTVRAGTTRSVRHERRTTALRASAPDPHETFYGLAEKPFALAADPRFFFHSTQHAAVSQRLLTAIREREGLVILSGVPGVGKTTVCRTVMEQIDRRTLTSFVGDPFLTREELLKTVLSDFGVMSREELARGPFATRHELSATLQAFVDSLAPLDASAVVIVDEAQNLPADVLDQIRILAEAAESRRLLQIVLVGSPALVALLCRPAHHPLHQRVTVRAAIEPLPAGEVAGYVAHRLAVAGPSAHIAFDESALQRLAQLSGGLPRIVNLLCDRALARAYEASADRIDAALIERAAGDLDLGQPRPKRRLMSARTAVAVLTLCGLIGAGLAAWAFRDALARTIAQWHAPSAPRSPARSPAPPARR